MTSSGDLLYNNVNAFCWTVQLKMTKLVNLMLCGFYKKKEILPSSSINKTEVELSDLAEAVVHDSNLSAPGLRPSHCPTRIAPKRTHFKSLSMSTSELPLEWFWMLKSSHALKSLNLKHPCGPFMDNQFILLTMVLKTMMWPILSVRLCPPLQPQLTASFHLGSGPGRWHDMIPHCCSLCLVILLAYTLPFPMLRMSHNYLLNLPTAYFPLAWKTRGVSSTASQPEGCFCFHPQYSWGSPFTPVIPPNCPIPPPYLFLGYHKLSRSSDELWGSLGRDPSTKEPCCLLLWFPL